MPLSNACCNILLFLQQFFPDLKSELIHPWWSFKSIIAKPQISVTWSDGKVLTNNKFAHSEWICVGQDWCGKLHLVAIIVLPQMSNMLIISGDFLRTTSYMINFTVCDFYVKIFTVILWHVQCLHSQKCLLIWNLSMLILLSNEKIAVAFVIHRGYKKKEDSFLSILLIYCNFFRQICYNKN